MGGGPLLVGFDARVSSYQAVSAQSAKDAEESDLDLCVAEIVIT